MFKCLCYFVFLYFLQNKHLTFENLHSSNTGEQISRLDLQIGDGLEAALFDLLENICALPANGPPDQQTTQ